MTSTLRSLIVSSMIVMGSLTAASPSVLAADTSTSAASLPTPQQIEQQIRANNFSQAKIMIDLVLEQKPDSAKAWYWKAQVEEKLNHSTEALSALNRAKTLRPDLRFASPGAVEALEKRLQPSSARHAAKTVSNASTASSALAVTSASSTVSPASTVTAASTQASTATVATAPAQKANDSGFSFFWFCVVLFLLIVLGFTIHFILQNHKKRELLKAFQTKQTSTLSVANSLSERVLSLNKKVRLSQQDSSIVGQAASRLQSSVTDFLSQVKMADVNSDTSSWDRQAHQLEQELASLEDLVHREQWNSTPAVPTASSTASSSTSSSSSRSQRTDSSYDDEVPHRSNSSYGYSQPPASSHSSTTVVVDQSPSLLQTMIMADAIRSSGHSSHDRDYERRLERENDELRRQQHKNNSQSWDDSDDSSSRSSSSRSSSSSSSFFDLGGSSGSSRSSWDDDDSSSRSSSRSSSFDYGSSSRSSSSSWDSDSYSSSSSSSSSSSDSYSSSSSDSSSSSSDW